jgi:hypothetical protein
MGGQPLPLQAILPMQGKLDNLTHLLTSPGSLGAKHPIIYVDGIRLAQHGMALQTIFDGRLLIDFDDLISRRVARMIRNNEEVSFGAFVRIVPRFIQAAIRRLHLIRSLLLRLEKPLLRRAELQAAATAEAIAFSSDYEARLFRRFQRRYAPRANPTYLVLGPSTRGQQQMISDTRPQQPSDIRFIFIGSDVLYQNRIAIREIIKLAHENSLAVPAYIFGRMTQKYDPPGNVSFCGFAETLGAVYKPGSILLLARSVRGGVKSKILEAFEHGIPPIGTSSALEGFEGSYPWRVDGLALRGLVGDVSRLRNGYQLAVSSGISICVAQFSSTRYWGVLGDYIGLVNKQGARQEERSVD